jgi:hypothetical protein
MVFRKMTGPQQSRTHIKVDIVLSPSPSSSKLGLFSSYTATCHLPNWNCSEIANQLNLLFNFSIFGGGLES